jgi:hypothetical protein
MIEGPQIPRKRKAIIRWIITTAVALAILVSLLIVLYPLSTLNREVASRLSGYLVRQLGPDASVAAVGLNWKSVTLHGVSLPLDDRGSRLDIPEIEVEIDLFGLIRQPSRAERMVHSVVAVHPALCIVFAPDTLAEKSDRRLLPRVVIPHGFFETVARMDSLKNLRVEDGVVLLQTEGRRQPILQGLNGRILQSRPGEIRLTASAHYLGDLRNSVKITGALTPADYRMEIGAVAHVPRGTFPAVLDSSLSISSEGGDASLKFSVLDSVSDLHISLSVSSVDVATRFGRFHMDSARVAVNRDTLFLSNLKIESGSLDGVLDGKIALTESGALLLRGHAQATDLSFLQALSRDLPVIEGHSEVEFTIAGNVRDPIVEMSLKAASLNVAGTGVANLRSEGTLHDDTLLIRQLQFDIAQGHGQLNGIVILDDKPHLSIAGQFELSGSQSLPDWSPNLRTVLLRADCMLDEPQGTVQFLSDSGHVLGNATVRKQEDMLLLNVTPSSAEGTTTLWFSFENGLQSINAEHAQYLLSVFLKQRDQVWLKSISSLTVSFAGDRRLGDIGVHAVIAQDSNIVWTQIAREFQFTGCYTLSDSAKYGFVGRWSGVSGGGDPFEGRADVTIQNNCITANHFFVDQVGDVRGHVDLQAKSLDLSLAVQDLPFERFPIKPAFLTRAKMSGSLLGNLHVYGELADPAWNTSLSLVDCSVFDVTGYWMNLELAGKGLKVDVERAELGRDVRGIVSAFGTVDLDADNIYIEASAGAALVEDFILAVAGVTGLASGELDGTAKLSGKLSAPSVDAQFEIRSGKLLGALHVDGLSGKISSNVDALGQREIQVSEFSFFKNAMYRFVGNAEAALPSGRFKAHLEGDGNLLDLVDQLERNFHTLESECAVSMDFGGTLDKPEFLGGDLTIADGLFSYSDATPVTVSVNASVAVVAPGIVEKSEFRFVSGDQSITLRVIPVGKKDYPDLKPLVIPSPRLELGVLEIETNDNGMPFHIPGFMKPDWLGNFTVGSIAGRPLTISAYDSTTLYIHGDVAVRNARVTFPLQKGSGKPTPPVARWILKRLEEAMWDVHLGVGSGNHYEVEITGLKDSQVFAPLRDSPVLSTLADYLDHISIDALVNPTDVPLRIRETIADTSFYVQGQVATNRGRVEYLDQTFAIDYAYADFDETNVKPVIEGRAKTIGVDSLGQKQPVYLTIYQIDRETKARQKRGRLDDVTFILETETGGSPEEALQLLGYGTVSAAGKAEDLAAAAVARIIGRQWLEPIERRIEKWAWLDEVALNPGGGRSPNVLRQQREKALADTLKQSAALRFITGSQVTLGKYLGDDVFVTYTGELSGTQNALTGSRLGFVHFWNIEYRIKPLSRDLVLDLAVEYDAVERKQDESISLKYSFTLEP